MISVRFISVGNCVFLMFTYLSIERKNRERKGKKERGKKRKSLWERNLGEVILEEK